MTLRHLPRRTPFAFGLTFVPPQALGVLAADAIDPAAAIAGACDALEAAFAFVPSWEPWATAAVDRLVDAGVSVFWVVEGPLWPILESDGIAQGLRRTLTEPAAMADEIERGLDAVIGRARRGLEAGASVIVLAEDLAGSEGPLVAPDFAIDRLLPAYSAVSMMAEQFSALAVMHSDGDTRWLLGAVKRAGFTALHAGGGLGFDAFERLFWAARAIDLAVIGGMQSVELLGGLARAEVLGSRVGLLAKAGGLLVADDGGLTSAREVTALSHALEVARSV